MAINNAELSVLFSTNIGELEKDLRRGGESLEDLGNKAEKSSKKVKNAGEKSEDGFKKTEKGAANALPALTDFSRIIQDAPFGIIGVGNNITQLATSFGNLQTKTGTAGSAFRAMLGSLAGPGGLVFAISTAVTLLTVFGDKLFSLIGKSDALAQSFKGVFESVAGQKGEVEALSRIILDLGESVEVRQGALDELAKKYPEYLKGIDLEKTAYENLKAAVKGANDEVIRGARIKALQGVIEEKLKEGAEDLGDAYSRQQKAREALNRSLSKTIDDNAIFQTVDRNASPKEQLKQITDLANRYGFSQQKLAGLAQAVNEYNEANTELTGIISEQDKEIEGIVGSLTKLSAEQIRAKQEGEKFAESLQEFQGEEVVLTAPEAKLDKPKWDKESVKKLFDQLDKDLAALAEQEGLDDMAEAVRIAVTDSGYRSPDAPDVDDSAIVEQENYLEQLAELDRQAGRMIQGSLFNTFSGIGDVIGQAIADGGNVISAFGNGLLASFSGFLSQMGDLLIQYGLLAVTKGKLDTAIGIGGIAAIGAGLAAIAAGTLLKAAGSALGSRAQQGFSGAGAGGGASSGASYSGAISSSYNPGFDGGTVVFEIAGTKLVGVLNRTLKKDRRTLGDIL